MLLSLLFMMDLWQKDLIQTITKSLKEREIVISVDLITFLIQLTSLNPDYQKDDGEVDIKSVAEIVTKKVFNKTNAILIVMKMQLYFMKEYQSRDIKIMERRQRLKQKTQPLMKEIFSAHNMENDRCAQKLYQKIMIVITLLSGLGKPTTPSVLREVESALQSVFQPTELSYFLALSDSKKEEYLIELMSIVAGIRIFNKDCGRGGAGIEDIPSILENIISRTEATIVVSLEDVMNKIYKYTTAIEQFLPCFETETTLDSEKQAFFTNAVEKLTCLRQEEFYLRKILADTKICKEEAKNLLMNLRKRLLYLHKTVSCTNAIPFSRIYSQFVDLADIWLKLQDEVIVLSQVNNFLARLQSLCVTINLYEDYELEQIIRDVDVLTDVDRLKLSMGKLIKKCGSCRILYPNDRKDFDKINLEFLGFCPRTFLVGNGVLIRGNPNMGIVEWEGKYFAFSSQVAAQKFGEDPNRHITEVLNFIKERPEFIYLLQMNDIIEQLPDIKQMSSETRIKHCNQETQTDIHILKPYINKNYSWSVWEHRRTLKLAKITRCVTKSTQTIKSHFRNELEVQVAPPEDKEIQTKIDNFTNTKNIIPYIPGLRGKYTKD